METQKNLTNHCKSHKEDGRFALRKYSPISKKDLAVRFKITALPLILKKTLLPSLDLTIKAWALLKAQTHPERRAWGPQLRGRAGVGKGGRAHRAQETFPGTAHRAAPPSRLKCAVYSRVRLGIPPMSPARAFPRWLCQSWSRVRGYYARRTRGQETGGKRPQIPAPLGAAVVGRCPLALCLLNLLPFPEILLTEDSFTFTCGIRLRNAQPLPLLTPVSKPLTPNGLAKKMISLKKKPTRAGITN